MVFSCNIVFVDLSFFGLLDVVFFFEFIDEGFNSDIIELDDEIVVVVCVIEY